MKANLFYLIVFSIFLSLKPAIANERIENCRGILERITQIEKFAKVLSYPEKEDVEKQLEMLRSTLEGALANQYRLKSLDDYLVDQEKSPEAAFSPKIPPNVPEWLLNTFSDTNLYKTLGPKARDLFSEAGNDPQKRLLALAMSPEGRELLVNNATQALRASETDLAKLKNVDVFFVGAGPHEQVIQNVFRQGNAKLSTLTAEKSDEVARTFALGGSAVNLNSPSRPVDRTALRQSSTKEADGGDGGDLNFLPGGVLQLRDFETRKNPLLGSMATAIIVNRALAPGKVMFKEEVKRWDIETDPQLSENGKYPIRIELESGKVFHARALVQTVGIGSNKVNAVEGMLAARTAERAFERKPTQRGTLPPWILSNYDEYRENIRNNPHPLEPFSGKRVAIIGDGDSAKSVVRFLGGLADAEAYGRDTRSVGGPKKIGWFGQECTNCEDFINKNRAFYADIGQLFKNGTLESLPRAGSVSVLNDVASIIPKKGIPSDWDYVIDCTGSVPKVVPKKNAPPSTNVADDGFYRDVVGEEPGLGRVTYARQAIGKNGEPLNVFVVGPAAGRIVSEKELAGVPQNVVALKNHVWRGWRIGAALEKQLAGENFTKIALDAPGTGGASGPVTVSLTLPTSNRNQESLPTFSQTRDILVERFLERFSSNNDRVQLRVYRPDRDGKASISIFRNGSDRFSSATRQKFIQWIESQYGLRQELGDYFRGEGKNDLSFWVDLSFNNGIATRLSIINRSN